MTKLWIGRTYIGDEPITKTTFNDDEDGHRWLEHFKSEALSSHHPEFRLEVSEYNLVRTEVFKPTNPSTLEDLGL
jgi:hypothetical protein